MMFFLINGEECGFVVFEIGSIAVSRSDASPVKALPVFGVRQPHVTDGSLLVFAFEQRYTQALYAVVAANVTTVAVGAFLVMFASL